MVQSKGLSLGIVDFSQVRLRSVEQALTKRNLLLAMFTGAVPVPGVIPHAILSTFVLNNPEDQCGMTAPVGNFTLEADNGWIDLLLQPVRRLTRRQSVNTRLETGDNQRSVIDERQIVSTPTLGIQTTKLPKTYDLVWLAYLVQLVRIPQEADASADPEIVVC